VWVFGGCHISFSNAVADGVLIIPARATTTSTFDADGNLVSQTDPLGNTTSWSL